MKKKIFKWALVLSGGGARGFAHIGILKKLEDSGFPKPSLVAGTSMGAIIGGLYACGMSPLEMERFIIEEFNITNYLDSFVFKINGPVGKVIQTGQVLASLAGRPGIDTGKQVLKLLEKLTAKKRFSDTEIAFRCNAVDLLSGREVIFDSGSVARAMRASMSLPVFLEPFKEKGMYFVDGGVADNMPVAIARKEGFKRVLAVNVNDFCDLNSGDLKNGPQVIFRSLDCAINAQGMEKKAQANLTLNVRIDETLFSFFKHKELINLGEQTVKKNLNALNDFFEIPKLPSGKHKSSIIPSGPLKLANAPEKSL
jgi:NTE family protein